MRRSSASPSLPVSPKPAETTMAPFTPALAHSRSTSGTVGRRRRDDGQVDVLGHGRDGRQTLDAEDRVAVPVDRIQRPALRAHQVLHDGSADRAFCLGRPDQGDGLRVEHSAHVRTPPEGVFPLSVWQHLRAGRHPRPAASTRTGILGTNWTHMTTARRGRGGPMDRAALIWDPALAAYDLGDTHPLNPLRLTLTVELMEAFGLLGPDVVISPTGRHRERAAARPFEQLHRGGAPRRRLGVGLQAEHGPGHRGQPHLSRACTRSPR